jgi:hypothetical protein
MSDWDGFGGNDDDNTYEEYEINDVLFGRDPDMHALELMWGAVEAGRHDTAAWTEFGDYLYDFYGIELEAEWDWADFVEWYNEQ